MKKLNYNVASRQQVNRTRLITGVAVLLLATIVLLTAAYILVTEQKQKQSGQREELRMMRAELADLQTRMENYDTRVEELRKQWRSRVNFANQLIRRKQHSLTAKLDRLEELLPVGAFVQSLKIQDPGSPRVELSMVAYSFNTLLELYKRFSDHGLHIKSETNESGVYRASIVVSLGNEKR